MANTTNLDLVKPLGTDRALVAVINSNMDKIDAYAGKTDDAIGGLADGLAIVTNGDTHVAITSGQFVYVRNHNTLSEGLYVATANIAEDGTLSGSNLTADSSGGLNTVYDTLNDKLSANSNIYNWGTVTSTIASKIASESANHKGEGNWGARFYFNASNPPSDLPVNELKWRYATAEFYARNTDNSGNTDGYLILRAFGTSETIECNVTSNTLGTWTSLTETIVMDLTSPSTKTSVELDYPTGCSGNNCLVASTLLYIYGRWYYSADRIFGYTVANTANKIYVDFSLAEDRALGVPYRIVMNKVHT